MDLLLYPTFPQFQFVCHISVSHSALVAIITLSVSLSTPPNSPVSHTKTPFLFLWTKHNHSFSLPSLFLSHSLYLCEMGLEIVDEFRPITPPLTLRITCTTQQNPEEAVSADPKECHTPTSPSQILKTPLVCPPAPKKPRGPRRTNISAAHPFILVPDDVASVFLLHVTTPASTNISTGASLQPTFSSWSQEKRIHFNAAGIYLNVTLINQSPSYSYLQYINCYVSFNV